MYLTVDTKRAHSWGNWTFVRSRVQGKNSKIFIGVFASSAESQCMAFPYDVYHASAEVAGTSRTYVGYCNHQALGYEGRCTEHSNGEDAGGAPWLRRPRKKMPDGEVRGKLVRTVNGKMAALRLEAVEFFRLWMSSASTDMAVRTIRGGPFPMCRLDNQHLAEIATVASALQYLTTEKDCARALALLTEEEAPRTFRHLQNRKRAAEEVPASVEVPPRKRLPASASLLGGEAHWNSSRNRWQSGASDFVYVVENNGNFEVREFGVRGHLESSHSSFEKAREAAGQVAKSIRKRDPRKQEYNFNQDRPGGTVVYK